MPTFPGDQGANVLNGTAGNDMLIGYGGDDTLNGLDGNDILIGNLGADALDGGNGDDVLYSGDESPPYSFPYYGISFTPPLLDVGAEHDRLIGGAGMTACSLAMATTSMAGRTMLPATICSSVSSARQAA